MFSILYSKISIIIWIKIVQVNLLLCMMSNKFEIFLCFYAKLAYIRHFLLAGCYDNDPWYLATNLAGHLNLA